MTDSGRGLRSDQFFIFSFYFFNGPRQKIIIIKNEKMHIHSKTLRIMSNNAVHCGREGRLPSDPQGGILPPQGDG